MGKVTKKVWLILIIVALALPMFVGCKPEPEVDLVGEAKSAFITYLKGKVSDTGAATLEVTGNNLKITFKTNNAAQIKTAADSLVDELKTKAQTDKELKIGSKSYTLAAADVVTIKNDLLALFTGTSGTTTYEVHVNHNSQKFTLQGNLEFVTP
jgi:hypothetical protein